MPDVTSISSLYNTTSSTSTTSRVAGGELGMNEFLELLTVQLTNQDPLEPMEDTDFIAQMAQFSSLEAMTTLTESFASQQAYSLVGKNVVAKANIDGVAVEIYGMVSGALNQNGKNLLQVGDYLVELSDVQAVYSGAQEEANISQAANLIGKKITAEVPATGTDAVESGATETIEGTVEYVLLKGDGLYVKCEGLDTEVPVAYITKISQ